MYVVGITWGITKAELILSHPQYLIKTPEQKRTSVGVFNSTQKLEISKVINIRM